MGWKLIKTHRNIRKKTLRDDKINNNTCIEFLFLFLKRTTYIYIYDQIYDIGQ